MQQWTRTLVTVDATLREAIAAIDAAGVHISLIVDDDRRLLGVLTDGDVRRGLLRGVSLDAAVEDLMNPSPITAHEEDDDDAILALMRRRHLYQIPLVDGDGRVVGLKALDDLVLPAQRTTPVVLMAGGLGTRLRPLTQNRPKPLLEVGSKPLLETILETFVAQGFVRFFISIHYKAEMIQDYFGAGERWGVDIQYLHEDEKLGTAGALSLLPERPEEPLLIMNGDLLTNLTFSHLLSFHSEQQAMATMCVREYDMQVPYGVVRADGCRILGLEEKPVQRHLINGGIYVLEPEALQFVEPDTPLDMTDLFQQLVDEGHHAAVYPIREYWLDIGHVEDFQRARGEISTVFDRDA
ncbi:MAG: CBS domain-containing protein [Bacteroidetes bacterium]|jgi:dTDP-glucose pyrophosphorylase|nr:CBS domain-containing protein [Bacteroidota bacterium]